MEGVERIWHNGNRIARVWMAEDEIAIFFEDVEKGQLARGFCTMWAHVVRDACPLDETGKAIR